MRENLLVQVLDCVYLVLQIFKLIIGNLQRNNFRLLAQVQSVIKYARCRQDSALVLKNNYHLPYLILFYYANQQNNTGADHGILPEY